MKTREFFIIMRTGKIDKRDHEIAKKTQFCQFVNNTSYQIGKFVKCAGEIEFWSKLCAGNLKAFRGQLRFAG